MRVRKLLLLPSVFVTALSKEEVAQLVTNAGLGSLDGLPAVSAVHQDTRTTSPMIQLDRGTFVGASDGITSKFYGIPFAKAPVEDLRFNLPVAVDPYNGTYDATSYGPACPQQSAHLLEWPGVPVETQNLLSSIIFQAVLPSSEDCLSVNVVIPTGTDPDAKLPVVVWIYGGGFETGGSSFALYDGAVIVKRSIDLGERVVYVSMNYRLSAFGFLASAEVKNAGVGNLGLQDQRLALRWVQKYISAFGGDPTKVTIWGESAGAMSVAIQMLTNGGDTEGLFQGAFMNSGSPIPSGDISDGQDDYDRLVVETGCSSATNTLQCLRKAPYDKLKEAMDRSPSFVGYESLHMTWTPRADGNFLRDTPQRLVQQGSVANVPFVTGDCDDEGTLFALGNLNVTTEEQLRDYVVSNYFPGISEEDLDELLRVYPADITQGSPFNTSILNAISPEYKRIAAIAGDILLQAPRRFFLQHRSSKQPTWSFLNKRLKDTPVTGSCHFTDLFNFYGGGDMTDYLVYFVNHLDPNGKTGTSWPKYTISSPKLLTFLDGLEPVAITDDDFRVDGMNFLTKLLLKVPLK